MIDLRDALGKNIEEAIGILGRFEDQKICFSDFGDKPFVLVTDLSDNLIEGVVDECFADDDSICLVVNATLPHNGSDFIMSYDISDCVGYTANNVCEMICEIGNKE